MRSERKPDSRRSAGLVFARIHHGASQATWPAIVDEAARRGINLFCFPGGRIGLEGTYEISRNSVFDLAAEAPLDGMLMWTSTLVGPGPDSDLEALTRRWSDIPAVGISAQTPGIPAVMIDFYSGMGEALRHLTGAHGSRRIAFVRGPEFHQSANERYQAYLDVLAEAGIPIDPALVSSPTDWTEGARAVAELLDDRGLLPGRDFQAIAFSSDLLALWAAMTLQSRGYRIPEDVAVVGVNDIVESRVATPPLTTVAAPFAELGVLALDTLLDRMDGKDVPELKTLPARLVLRQSCGCSSRSFRLAGGEATPDQTARQAMETEELAAAWEEAVFSGGGKPFFARLLERIDACVRGGLDVQPLQDTISSLRASVAVRSGEPGMSGFLRRMEDLAGQARVLVAEGTERAMRYRAWEKDRHGDAIADLDHALLAALDFGSLPGILAPALAGLGIRSAYICTYGAEGPRGMSRLVFAYRDGETLDADIPVAMRPAFPSGDLLPPGYFPGRQLAYMVEPLFFHDNPIGYCLLEIGSREGMLYEELRDSISNALRSIILFERIERERAASERANAIKTRLLSNVSSELEIPVERILESAGRLAGEREPGTGYDPAADVDAIKREAGHQRRLVNDLLDLSRAEIDELAIHMEPTEVAPIVLGVFAALRHAVRPEVQWSLDIQDNLPAVMADPARLRQIVTNLVGNAVKFTAAGRIAIDARLESACAPGSFPPAPRIRITVADTGSGIAASRLDTIFEPFISTADGQGASGGVGLGLSIARHLAELHLGRIEVESAPGKGSDFHVLLPVRDRGEDVAQGDLPATASVVVNNVIDYIKKHYQGNITRWKLADAANVSEFYVSRLFRKETGITLWEYLTRIRLAKARELLLEGDDSIAIVGEKVGFADQAYFSRVFRKATGMSPVAFRASGRKRTGTRSRQSEQGRQGVPAVSPAGQSRSAWTDGSSRKASPR